MGTNSAKNNTGNNINALGNSSADRNTGRDVNALGFLAAAFNTFNNVNLFGAFASADENGQTVFGKTSAIFARLSTLLLTATRKYILPDESGTIALESYVDAKLNPTLNVLPKKGASGFVDSAIIEDAFNVNSAKPIRILTDGTKPSLILESSNYVNSPTNAIDFRDFTGLNVAKIDTRYDGATVSIIFGSLYNSGYNSNPLFIMKGDGKFGIGTATPSDNLEVNGSIKLSNLLKLGQFTTATEPAYVKGAQFFNTTLNKMRIGGATAYETVTSS
jgi:hypothetical protein